MTIKINEKLVKITVDLILQEYEINVLENPRCRFRDLVDYRALAMKVIKQTTTLPLKKIGDIWKTENYKGKDHASVLHNIKMFGFLIETNKEFSERYRRILFMVQEAKYILLNNNKYEDDLIGDVKKQRARNMALINKDLNRKQLMISIQRKINMLPTRYQKDLLSVFKINDVYDNNKKNIFI